MSKKCKYCEATLVPTIDGRCPRCHNRQEGEQEYPIKYVGTDKKYSTIHCTNQRPNRSTEYNTETIKPIHKPIQHNSSNPTVQCPYCKSTNTQKISAMNKAVHTALFGIFSMSRNSKQWYCNNCKSDF